MTYRVYQSDIDAGLAEDCMYCPVAKAIHRRHPSQKIHVGYQYADIDDHGYKLPDRVRQWILAFDEGKPVRPFRFELIETAD